MWSDLAPVDADPETVLARCCSGHLALEVPAHNGGGVPCSLRIVITYGFRPQSGSMILPLVALSISCIQQSSAWMNSASSCRPTPACRQPGALAFQRRGQGPPPPSPHPGSSQVPEASFHAGVVARMTLRRPLGPANREAQLPATAFARPWPIVLYVGSVYTAMERAQLSTLCSPTLSLIAWNLLSHMVHAFFLVQLCSALAVTLQPLPVHLSSWIQSSSRRAVSQGPWPPTTRTMRGVIDGEGRDGRDGLAQVAVQLLNQALQGVVCVHSAQFLRNVACVRGETLDVDDLRDPISGVPRAPAARSACARASAAGARSGSWCP